jgi:lipopolysaccharide biosynthesis glycosyltransferase
MKRSIYIGYDPREVEAFAVCRHSLQRYTDIPIQAICLDDVRDAGMYWRPMSKRDGKLWDNISAAPCATEFAISRFLTPMLAREGWAVFMDCDILARTDINDLFAMADPRYAVMCVQHHHAPTHETLKMDGQLQTLYARKNWSSVMMFNCDHPSNRDLTINLINTVPGRDLHRFCWLRDDEIGDLPMSWNWLVGASDPEIAPDLVHFTSGGPWFEGYEHVPYADEWREVRREWLGQNMVIASLPNGATQMEMVHGR